VSAIFEARNQGQDATEPVWVPRPPPGRYEVTFALVNAKGQPVAQKLAPPLTVR